MTACHNDFRAHRCHMRRRRTGKSQALHGALKDAQTGFQALAAITAELLTAVPSGSLTLHAQVYMRVLCTPCYRALAR